ncbi:MAG: sugar phosphate isomerase/epimerase family protein [Verrucomicrobiales bacterium]
MISFSTCWSRKKHFFDRILEIQEMGFSHVEVSHGVRVPGIQQTLKRIAKGMSAPISSVHNFCPHPIDVGGYSPDTFEPTSHRTRDRSRWQRLTLGSIETASKLNAQAVVLHLGRIPLPKVTSQLGEWAEHRQLFSRRYVQTKLKTVAKRAKLAPKYLDRVKKQLEPIVEAAAQANIQLGIECRDQFEQVPTHEEVLDLLETFHGGPVGYWHDFGHAQIQDHLGFLDHKECLQALGPSTIGCHIHDVTWARRDHRIPFTGLIDWDALVPFLPDNCLQVFELHYRQPKRDIPQARDTWIALWNKNHPPAHPPQEISQPPPQANPKATAQAKH